MTPDEEDRWVHQQSGRRTVEQRLNAQETTINALQNQIGELQVRVRELEGQLHNLSHFVGAAHCEH